MGKISVISACKSGSTVISNIFIDKYMPTANGAYIKVFLYLLRHLNDNHEPFTLQNAADSLDESERDILRALRYWESVNVLSLHKDETDNLIGITLLDLDTAPAVSDISVPAPASSDVLSRLAETPSAKGFVSGSLSAQEEADIAWIRSILEGNDYNHMIKHDDIELIIYLMRELHFSGSYVLSLYMECIEKGKPSCRYIKAMAEALYNDGIESELDYQRYKQDVSTISLSIKKAFGFKRSLGEAELGFVNKWRATGISIELIEEACNRTIMSAKQPSFQYADAIIMKWVCDGILTKEALNNAGSPYASKKNKTTAKPSGNRFQNYTQREYSGEQLDELEKKLLEH